jgi:hypothetical protein
VRNSLLAEIHPLNFPPENYPVVKFWVNFERVNFQQGALLLVQSSTSREVVAQKTQGDSLSPVHIQLVLAHAGSELAEMGVFWSE